MDKKNKYTIYEHNEDPLCLKLKYEKPGEDIMILFRDIIKKFLSESNSSMFNGGWAIHNALIQIDPKYALYDSNNICDTSDFDLFGYKPVEDMINLAYELSKQIPKKNMEFDVDPGMHPNQYRLNVRFMGIKIIDLIYISKKIYNFLEKEKTDGLLYINSNIELMRQYYFITNIFMFSPTNSIDKILNRINLLEKNILIPQLKSKKIWNLRKNILENIYSNDNEIIEISKIIKKFVKENEYICKVGLLTYNNIFKNNDTSFISKNENINKTKVKQEYVIHDEIYYTIINKLLKLLKNTDFDITIEFRDSFIGVIGPLYNGWVDIYINNVLIASFYSLATPVHVYINKHCSYFFNLAHCMWRELYFKYIKNKESELFYTTIISKFLKQSENNRNNDFFKYKINISNFVGVYPFRNYYQVSNKLRTRKEYYFKIGIPDNKNKNVEDYFYRDFEGKLLLGIKLKKLKKTFRLHYLYRRGEIKDLNNKNKK